MDLAWTSSSALAERARALPVSPEVQKLLLRPAMPQRRIVMGVNRNFVLGALLLALPSCSGANAGAGDSADNSDVRETEDGDAAATPTSSDGDSGSAGDAGVAQGGTRDGGQASGNALAGIKLCDGSASLRLAFEGDRSDCEGTDFKCPGGSVFAELGPIHLYLDGRCNLYMRPAPPSGTRVKKLTEKELDALLTQLAVADWPPAGTYCNNLSGVFDLGGLGTRYYLMGAVINMQYCVDGRPIAIRAEAAPQYIRDHYSEGEPLAGPVRYTLVATDSPENFAFGFAKPFPLETLNSVVRTTHSSSIMFAEGADAEKLRALREAYLQATGPQAANFVPALRADAGAVLEADAGAPFELRVRDVLPLEQAPGQETLF
jgi:hypothetical protein